MNLIDRIMQAIPDRPSDASGSSGPVFEDNPPTVRVAIVCGSDTPSVPRIEMTPPPASHRKLAGIASVLGSAQPGESKEIRFPGVGTLFHGFQLVEELGRGAFARVYLAEQTSLAGRLVALKVTLRATHEAERLARLQHTNIVPVYSVHDSAPVQLICMPYLGRQTIADRIRTYRNEQSTRSAAALRHTSHVARADKTTAVAGGLSKRIMLPSSGIYSRPILAEDAQPLVREPLAVLHVLTRLAAGLAHAHARNILHLDLKPANVLLADDGEPMLLDFNLSFDTTAPTRELVGGTIPYMAIEQLIDLKSHGKGQVDARTDLYSLGVMAFEMLTGEVPFPAQPRADIPSLIAARHAGPPSLRALNPDITPAVEAIVRKLLAPEPADRYQTAEELLIDLDRHMNHQPLAIATEPSRSERFAKWKRRNPGVFGRLLAACGLGLLLGLGTAAYLRAESHAKVIATVHAQGTRGPLGGTRLDLILPNDPTARARGIARAEEFLAEFGSPDDDGWADRTEIGRLGEKDRGLLAGDLREVRALLAQAKGEPIGEVKFEGEPSAARGHFLSASREMSANRFVAAVALLEKVVAAEPGHAAAQFCLAYSRQQLGQTDRAIERYETARTLLPRDPRPAYQCGVLFAGLGNARQAEVEYTQAIELDAEHALAHRNRGFARFRLEKFAESEEDLTRALELGGAGDYVVHTYRAQVRDALGDTVGAAEDRRTIAGVVPKTEGDLLARGVSYLKDAPEKSLADFDAALKLNPRSIVALTNRAHVLAERLGRTEDGLAAQSKLCQLYPEYVTARIVRAVYLARLGQRAEAHAEAAKAHRASNNDPVVTYRVACVYALTSATNPEDRGKAIEALDRALKQGFRNLSDLKSDPDLNALRGAKRFDEILNAANELFQ